MKSTSQEKANLTKDIDSLRGELRKALTDAAAPEGAMDWRVEFAEVFDENAGFDVVLANPPYVRADAQFRHLENEDERQAAIAKWRDYRAVLLKSGDYQTLYEKWDLYLPFLERAYQLLSANGRMVFIISDAYNAAKYTQKSHEFFLNNARIERIDFCTDIPLFQAGINNTIVHFAKATPDSGHQPLRVRRWGENSDHFERNTEVLPTGSQMDFDASTFRPEKQKAVQITQGFVPLEKICFVSKGMVINADERGYQGTFTASDLLSDVRDKKHPKRFVLGKDVEKWRLRNLRFLEWGTHRAPARFSRPTFCEMHEAREKLVAMRTPGPVPKVIYDADHLHFDASSVGFVPWHYLRGVRNKSIRKTAKYRNEVKRNETSPATLREELEELSQQFAPKYLLAVMNSTFAKEWLAGRRRSKFHIYPDDWKPLPIVPATVEEQAAIIALVDEILALYAKLGYPLTPEAQSRLQELEQQIDERVARLCGLNK